MNVHDLGKEMTDYVLSQILLSVYFSSSDGQVQVLSAFASEAVGSDLIPSQVKAMTFKIIQLPCLTLSTEGRLNGEQILATLHRRHWSV